MMQKIFISEAKSPNREIYLQKTKDWDKLLLYEEEGTLWLWAWSDLLGWEKPITWLFSPVVGNYPRPGDLWGVDEDGELILVETKFNRGRTDPFKDFVNNDEFAKEYEARNLYDRWQSLYKKEKKFISEELDSLELITQKSNAAPGVTPYSSKRLTTRRWASLYRDNIAPSILDKEYVIAVRKKLDVRRLKGNPPPQYVGYIVSPKYQAIKLSNTGKKHYDILNQKTMMKRVYLIGVSVENIGNDRVRIFSWRTDAN